MKRFISLLLTVFLLSSLTAFAAAPLWTRTEGDGSYVTVRVPYPQGASLSWGDAHYLSLRYADTKESVPLASDYQRGYLFATVPAADTDRPLEVFQGQRFEWTDIRWNNEPMGANILQIRGVIQGDEQGRLNLDQPLTRAEAFTVLVRLLSLEPAGDPGYADVSPDNWFYDAVSAARAAGLAAADTRFRPRDSVTRAEFTVMLARAFTRVGWLQPWDGGEVDLALADAETIPGWAMDAYLALGSINTSILNSTQCYNEEERDPYDGTPLIYWLAEAGKPATRQEVIKQIYNAMRWLPVYPTEEAIAWGFDKDMPSLDGSTSTYPYTCTLYDSLFTNHAAHPSFPAAHSKSHASYERLIAGEVDALFAATKPSADLTAQAKAAGVELECIPIAHDAMVFFTNAENPVSSLMVEQLQGIYAQNIYDNWSRLGGTDAKLLPYCRNRDSGSHALMEELILKGGALHERILNGNVSLAMSSALTDVAAALETDPPAYAIGYSVYYYYLTASTMMGDVTDNELKLLAVNGVMPTEETIADGSYPLAGYNYLVIRADAPADAPVRRLAQFLLSEAGQEIVSRAGFGALKN